MHPAFSRPAHAQPQAPPAPAPRKSSDVGAGSVGGGRPAVVVFIAASLDGFIARPDGGIDWLPQPEGEEDFGFGALMDSVDFVVMGRSTFEQVLSFGDVWPYTKPVVVLSRSLREVPQRLKGKVSIAAGEPSEVLRELSAGGARRVYIDGGNVIQEFLKADLVDELVLTTIPVLIGKGIPLFGELPSDLTWQVKDTQLYTKVNFVKTTYSRKH